MAPGRFALPVLMLAVLVGAAACTGGGDEQSAESKPSASSSGSGATAKAYDPSASTATVSGRATFKGAPPPAQPVKMAADPYCAEANTEVAPRPPFLVGASGELAEVFVYVKSGLEGVEFPPATKAVVLDQKNCNYDPKVIGLQVGQPLEIRNSDATLHNVHAMPERSTGFNIGMPRKDMTSTRKFAEPEVLVRIKCDVHPWMEAFAGVVPHPMFAVTGADGRYSITGLPAGTYTIEAVHFRLGRREAAVEVAAGGQATADFAFER